MSAKQMVLRKITKIEFCRNGSDSLRLLQQTVFIILLFYYCWTPVYKYTVRKDYSQVTIVHYCLPVHHFSVIVCSGKKDSFESPMVMFRMENKWCVLLDLMNDLSIIVGIYSMITHYSLVYSAERLCKWGTEAVTFPWNMTLALHVRSYSMSIISYGTLSRNLYSFDKIRFKWKGQNAATLSIYTMAVYKIIIQSCTCSKLVDLQTWLFVFACAYTGDWCTHIKALGVVSVVWTLANPSVQ